MGGRRYEGLRDQQRVSKGGEMREQNESGAENVEDTGTTRPALEQLKGDCNPATEILVRPLGECARGAVGGEKSEQNLFPTKNTKNMGEGNQGSRHTRLARMFPMAPLMHEHPQN